MEVKESLELRNSSQFVDQTFTYQFGKLSKVARIQLYRSVKSHVIGGSRLVVDIIFASEFCDPVLTLVEKYELMVACILEDGESAKSSYPISDGLVGTVCKFESNQGSSARFSFILPSMTGSYQLFFFSYPKAENIGNVRDCSNNLILPLLTDKTSVVTREQMILTASPKPLMSCYRSINGMLIEEEYGKTLGSHIYDSSIIIIRYLCQQYLRDDLNSAEKNDCFTKATGSLRYCHQFYFLSLMQSRHK
jgi:hypothetical protein